MEINIGKYVLGGGWIVSFRKLQLSALYSKLFAYVHKYMLYYCYTGEMKFCFAPY